MTFQLRPSLRLFLRFLTGRRTRTQLSRFALHPVIAIFNSSRT